MLNIILLPSKKMNPIDFKGHMIKGQGQTAYLVFEYCLSSGQRPKPESDPEVRFGSAFC